LALCEALINAVDDSVISFLKGIAGRNTKLLGQTSAAGAALAIAGAIARRGGLSLKFETVCAV